jgi:hypothetical protein
MKRRWVATAGAAAAVLVASAGVVVATTGAEEQSPPWAAGSTTTVQARWGQADGPGNQVPGRGQGQGYGSAQGQGSGQGHGARHGAQSAPDWCQNGPGNRAGGPGQHNGDPAANLPASTEISDATAQELLYMAEEEKLAHDLYVALGAQYDARQFDNIARAETRHLAAVRVLLDRYDLDDPTIGLQAGEFSNEALQQLYDDLLASGSTSLADAAQAGITVEETDIADLTGAIEGTNAPDVVRVLSSLRDGSERHLVAFERLADRT